MPASRPEHDLRPPTRPRTRSGPWLLLALLLAAALLWWFWWRPAGSPPAPAAQTDMHAPAPSDGEPPAAAAAPPTAPQFPIEPPETKAQAQALPPLADADAMVGEALTGLLGRGPVQNLLQTDGFVRRVVATVDNLPTPRASARLWPVQATPQRFAVASKDGVSVIAGENAGRYGPLLAFAEAVPLERAVQMYVRMYPLFQQAYEELGYPGRYFNDRLVAVLDHLLQTPEPAEPLRVRLLEVRGDLADPRPWVRYEFEDPALEALSSGQKILVRMGPANAKRAKTVLARLRALVAKGVAPR